MENNSQIVLPTFFTLTAIEGLVCIGLLLNLPQDPDSSWFSGYSLQRLILLVVAGVALILCLWLAIKTWRDTTVEDRWLGKFCTFMGRGNNGSHLLGILLVLVILGTWFVISTYTRSEFRLRPDLLALFESLRSYMLRLAPFVFWGLGVSLGIIGLIQFYGFGTKDNYTKAISGISLIVIPFILLVIFLIDRIDTRYYKWITREDDVVEWLTVVFLLLAGAFSLLSGLGIKNRWNRRFWFYLIFTIACILFSLEEISWGQRILGVESTQFFMENSDQQEINIHNVLQERFSFRTKHVASLVLFLYGTCLSLSALNPSIKSLVTKTGIPIPPLVLALGFALSGALSIDVFSGKEEEVGEMCLSVCLFLFMVLEYLRPQPLNPHSR